MIPFLFFALVSSVFNGSAFGADQFGLKNVREVMPGVLYRGGGEGGRQPISSGSMQNLCSYGFQSAYYVYRTGWGGDHGVSCGGGQTVYMSKQWDNSQQARAILTDIYNKIQTGGKVYVHCWYGVHASGYIAAIALRQFCGYSAEQGVTYWDSAVPASIRYEKVQQMVRNFSPYSDLQLSAAQQARVCP